MCVGGGGGGGGGERGLINLILHITECDDSIVISLLFCHVIEEICSNSTNSCRKDMQVLPSLNQQYSNSNWKIEDLAISICS